jgi:hypothetical protein
MKKLLVTAIAALLAVALVIPAYAEDRLELSGEFRLRGWDIRNEGFVDDADSAWFDQRMRIGAKINVSDNAHVMIRTDLGEGPWGNGQGLDLVNENAPKGGFNPGGVSRPTPGTSSMVDFDRLYMFMDQGMWNLTVGQQYYGLGILEVMDANMPGIKLGLNFGAVSPSFFYGKFDENDSLNDDGMNDDANLFGANFSFLLGENFDSNVFGAMIDDQATDDTKWSVGFHTQGKVGNLGLTGEVAHFGGDDGGPVDYTGTQFYLKAESAITEMFSLGGELLYAFGTDDANEVQITGLTDWWSFTPMSLNTPGAADFSATGSNPFDPSGDSAGVQAVMVFAQMNATDALSMGAKLGYFQPEDDDVTAWDSSFAWNAWVGYKLTGNTLASLTYLRTSPDVDGVDTEDEGTLYAKFQINF